MHRLATGSGYVDGNVVLVCRSHHKLVDGLSLEEILAKDGATFRAERHITATTQLLEAAALALFFLEATGYGNGHTADVLRAAISRSTGE
jgi:hypothetical protein